MAFCGVLKKCRLLVLCGCVCVLRKAVRRFNMVFEVDAWAPNIVHSTISISKIVSTMVSKHNCHITSSSSRVPDHCRRHIDPCKAHSPAHLPLFSWRGVYKPLPRCPNRLFLHTGAKPSILSLGQSVSHLGTLPHSNEPNLRSFKDTTALTNATDFEEAHYFKVVPGHLAG